MPDREEKDAGQERRLGRGGGGDRLKQLRAFCHAAQLKSMSRAADRLSLTQPAVSQQVRGLERELGAILFERRGPRIALTPAGDGLYRIALPLLQELDRLPERFAEQLGREVSGEVRILAGLTAATFLLPEYLQRFRAAHGGVRVTLRTGSLAEGLRLLYDREVDLALGAVELLPERLEFYHLVESRQVLIVPPGHPLTRVEKVSPQDLTAWPIVAPARGTATRQVMDFIAQRLGIELDVVVEARGWSVLRRLVEQEIGIAFVPDICVRGRDRVRVVPLQDSIDSQIRPAHYGVIVHRPEYLSLATRRLIQTMIPNFPNTPPK